MYLTPTYIILLDNSKLIYDKRTHFIYCILCKIEKNSIRDAQTPQPGETVFNTVTYIEVVKKYKDQDTFRAVSVI